MFKTTEDPLTMRTYKYKLLSAKRNKKLHRQINAGALAWNHCVAFTRRFYRFYGKSVSENVLKKHLTKLKKRQPYGYLCEMGSQALQDVVERLYRSYKRFLMPRRTEKNAVFPVLKKYVNTSRLRLSRRAKNCLTAMSLSSADRNTSISSPERSKERSRPSR